MNTKIEFFANAAEECNWLLVHSAIKSIESAILGDIIPFWLNLVAEG